MNITRYILLSCCTATFAAIPTTPPTTPEPIITHKHTIDYIKSLHVSGSYSIKLQHGDPGIVVTGTQEAIDALSIDITDNDLHLSPQHTQSGWFSRLFDFRDTDSSNYNIAITVTVPMLDSLTLSGTSDLSISGNIKPSNITLNGSSRLDITSPQDGKHLYARLRGNSTLNSAPLDYARTVIEQEGSSQSNVLTIQSNSLKLDLSGSSESIIKNIDVNTATVEQSDSSTSQLATSSTKLFNTNLHGASQQIISELKTKHLNARLHSASSLKIKSGYTEQSDIITYGEARTNFGTLTHGRLNIIKR